MNSSSVIQLTDEQQTIVHAPAGHYLINAVAGSGKTTTLAWRIRYLLEQGQDPKRLLVMMYNRSAKLDFEKKLAQICTDLNCPLPQIRTYHATGLRLCHHLVQKGLIPPFHEPLLSEQQVQFQIWLLLQKMAPPSLHGQLKREKKQMVALTVDYIEMVKSSLLPPAILFEQMGFKKGFQFIVDLFYQFEQWRQGQKRLTYADMLYLPVQFFKMHPEWENLASNKMDHVLVDEYQDTNEVQHQLLKIIAGQRAHVTVVGDPDQTIYEFRGAKPKYILHQFINEFSSAKALNLSYSFRYGHQVALLANHLISSNHARKDALCYAHETTPNTQVKLIKGENDAKKVVELVLSHQQSGGIFADIAVLCRVWSQSIPIELELLTQGIPYHSERTRGALQTTEAKSIFAILELATGHLETQSPASRRQTFDLIFHFPHLGIPENNIEKFVNHLAGVDSHWGDAFKQLNFADFKPFQQRKLLNTAKMLNKLEGCAHPDRKNKITLINLLSQYDKMTGLMEGVKALAMTEDYAEERVDTIEGFFQYFAQLKMPIHEALAHLQSLASNMHQPTQNSLTLSTIHRAKGLEYPVVIIPGLDNQHLPYQKRAQSTQFEGLESERRLFYVAMTRAIHQLFLLCPDNLQPQQPKPSAFIKELAFSLCDQLSQELNKTPEKRNWTHHTKSPLSDIAKKYANHFGWSISTPEITSITPALSDESIWVHPRVIHQLLGEGEVIEEEASAFRVRFKNGKQMNFSKSTASQYFSLPSTQSK
jgi:DNA helicase-2/ATP-dependent DNA helicase PcrA